MLRRELSKTYYTSLKVLIWIAAVLVAVVSACLGVNIEGWSKSTTILDGICLFRESAWWLLPTTMAIGGIAQVSRSRIGHPAVWDIVQYILDDFQERMFRKSRVQREEPQHFNRITLYKHMNFYWGLVKWPWSGWMIPVARSGFTTKSKISKFKASANQPDDAEGIAGQTMVQTQTIYIPELPDINHKSPVEKDMREYANQGLVSYDWVLKRKAKKHCPLSLLGIPVLVNGKPWGTIVFDSRRPKAINDRRALKDPYCRALTNLLSNVLVRV